MAKSKANSTQRHKPQIKNTLEVTCVSQIQRKKNINKEAVYLKI
jgi:hypothetical protein